jgi:hypothetical protein
VIVFSELPIVTGPVDEPVLIFVGKFESLFRFIAPPEIVAPELPVSNPADVIVPASVVYIFPLVVTLSPLLVGESTFPVRFQYPIVPEFGGAEVRVLDPSVYTPAFGVSPVTVNP